MIGAGLIALLIFAILLGAGLSNLAILVGLVCGVVIGLTLYRDGRFVY